MSERFKAIRILFKSVVGTANVIVILLFIASAFSDRISPDRSVFFSYLGLGFPVFCVLNLCFVVYWLFLWEMSLSQRMYVHRNNGAILCLELIKKAIL